MRYFFGILILCISFTSSSQDINSVAEHTLQNGLKVIVKEDHKAPVVVSMMWYKVGSVDEPRGITGISHALEHMMFRGTPKHPGQEFATIIASLGGQENAFTNNDYTAYYEKISAEHLPKCLELERDRMQNLLIREEDFAHEIKVVQEERLKRTDDNPKALTFERFMAHAHLATGYHHPVIGWMHDLKQMTASDLKDWYKKYYTPNNATLVIVGDVNKKEVFKLTESIFSDLPKSAAISRKQQQEPESLGSKTVTVKHDSNVPLLIMGYQTPSIMKNPHDAYTLELIAGILDAGQSARLERELVRNTEIAAVASAGYNLYSRYETQFLLFGIPSEKHSLEELQKSMEKEIKKLTEELIPTQELQKVKNQIIADKVFEQDSIFIQAMELGILETIGVGWQAKDNYIENINKITPKDILTVAKSYFTKTNATYAYLSS